MIDPIIDWLLKTIPAAYLADVLKLSFVIFSIVQILKISWRYTWQKPTEGFIHFLSVVTAAVAGLWMGPGGTLMERMGAAAVAWLITFVVAKYGLAILKWKWPALWAIINADRRGLRRQNRNNIPPAGDRRVGP